jgi:hypothetical protein
MPDGRPARTPETLAALAGREVGMGDETAVRCKGSTGSIFSRLPCMFAAKRDGFCGVHHPDAEDRRSDRARIQRQQNEDASMRRYWRTFAAKRQQWFWAQVAQVTLLARLRAAEGLATAVEAVDAHEDLSAPVLACDQCGPAEPASMTAARQALRDALTAYRAETGEGG